MLSRRVTREFDTKSTAVVLRQGAKLNVSKKFPKKYTLNFVVFLPCHL